MPKEQRARHAGVWGGVDAHISAGEWYRIDTLEGGPVGQHPSLPSGKVPACVSSQDAMLPLPFTSFWHTSPGLALKPLSHIESPPRGSPGHQERSQLPCHLNVITYPLAFSRPIQVSIEPTWRLLPQSNPDTGNHTQWGMVPTSTGLWSLPAGGSNCPSKLRLFLGWNLSCPPGVP